MAVLHGIHGSAFTWERVATRMQHKYRVITTDPRWLGHSDTPTRDYYMEGEARRIKDLLDRIGAK